MPVEDKVVTTVGVVVVPEEKAVVAKTEVAVVVVAVQVAAKAAKFKWSRMKIRDYIPIFLI